MRAVVMALLLVGCAAAPNTVEDPSVDEVNDPVDVEPTHVCDATAEAQFNAGSPWSPIEKDACFDGCEAGDSQGFSQGRLACIHGDDPCPDCAATQPDPAYDAGYASCFADSYEAGYLSEGCQP